MKCRLGGIHVRGLLLGDVRCRGRMENAEILEGKPY